LRTYLVTLTGSYAEDSTSRDRPFSRNEMFEKETPEALFAAIERHIDAFWKRMGKDTLGRAIRQKNVVISGIQIAEVTATEEVAFPTELLRKLNSG